MKVLIACEELQFQFTPPREGRPAVGRMVGFKDLFQFTPPREGRLFHAVLDLVNHLFQFTPPREGRQPLRQGRRSQPPNFNSRPRVRGDLSVRNISTEAIISIHAPA